MERRVEEFLAEAKRAREHAKKSNGELKIQWLRIAEMWELLAHEHRGLRASPHDKR